MGAHPYWYFVAYQPDIMTALQTLRQQEFEAGRYNPVNPFPFDPIFNEQAKEILEAEGLYEATFPSIEAAMEAADAEGSRSILDIQSVSEQPALCATSPVPTEVLMQVFRSDKPSRALVETVILQHQAPEGWSETGQSAAALVNQIGRGECRHLICYTDDQPSDIFFIGYSFD